PDRSSRIRREELDGEIGPPASSSGSAPSTLAKPACRAPGYPQDSFRLAIVSRPQTRPGRGCRGLLETRHVSLRIVGSLGMSTRQGLCGRAPAQRLLSCSCPNVLVPTDGWSGRVLGVLW